MLCRHEDIIFNGTASSAVTVHSGNAVGSGIQKGARHFIAISPDAIDAYAGTDTPPTSTVDVSFAAEGAAMLSDLRDAGIRLVLADAQDPESVGFKRWRAAFYVAGEPSQDPINNFIYNL